MAGPKILHQKRSISDRSPPARHNGGALRTSIHAKDDRAGKTAKGIPPTGTAESGIQIGPTVVTSVPAGVERCQLHVK